METLEGAASPEGVDQERPRRGARRNLVDLLYRLRTEADTPGLQSLAVAAGVVIGCLPVYGLHLPLCLAAGTLLRLNRITMYLASNLNNPVTGPFLVAAELQTGALLRRQQLLSLDTVGDIGLAAFAGDLVVGALAVGCTLAVAFGLVSYTLLRRNAHDRYRTLLVESAAKRYLAAGYLQWEIARHALRRDAVYLELLRQGFLPPTGRLTDLGCGRGLLLAVADTFAHAPPVPKPVGWSEPPTALDLVGVEANARHAETARRALGEAAEVRCEDPVTAELQQSAGVVLLDVLHRLEPVEQERLLARAVTALEPGGVLILREVAADRAWRWLPGSSSRHRSAAGWRAVLERLGLRVEEVVVSGATPSNRVVLVGRSPS